MFTQEIYNCTLDLMSHIPVEKHSHRTLLDDFNEFNADPINQWNAKARLVENGEIVDSSNFGLSASDEVHMSKLFAASESTLDGLKIRDIFSPSFFQTNYWYMLCTTFAFQPWHSIVEARRYGWRFIQEFPRMSTMSCVRNTRFNQYDSLVVPIKDWLHDRGVQFLLNHRVVSLRFTCLENGNERVEKIVYEKKNKREEVDVAKNDLTFFTNGSMTSNSSWGSMNSVPKRIRTAPQDSWAVWREIAANRPHFGNPDVFIGQFDKTKWESFSVTFTSTLFSNLMEIFTKNKSGTGGITTFRCSNWILSITIPSQPHFKNQPNDINFMWGYALRPDAPGNYVHKKMSECTGEEILTEVCSHLGFQKELTDIIASAECIPCLMPFITSQFMPRKIGDRPDVLPQKTSNFAFIGQFCEVPDEIVFTVEQSVRSAIIAVYGLLDISKTIPPIYQGQRDPKVVRELLDMGYDIAVNQSLVHHHESPKEEPWLKTP